MRISDWSSDVCSSDLQRHGFDLRRDRTEAKAGAVRAGRDRTGERLLVDVAEIHHPVAAVAQQMAEWLQRGAAKDARDVVRSEEHTSELQSLMRISYAVFCLKKKSYISNSKPNTRKDNTN